MTTTTSADRSPCSKCVDPAVVGVGQPPEWLCLDHWLEHLAGMKAQLDAIRGLLGRRTARAIARPQ